MSNVYQPPESNLLKDEGQGREYGSLEKAISGDYEFSIGDVLSEAWDKVGGCKWQFFLSVIIYSVVAMLLMSAMSIIVGALEASMVPDESSVAMMYLPILTQTGLNLILLPVITGVFIMGIRRSMGAPVDATSVFSHFSRMLPLFLTSILMMIMIMLGLFLLVLPGIYLMIAYYMAMPLVVEKGMDPWQALETSRKAITKRWFSVAGLFVILGVIMFISVLLLGIGLIWSGPLFMITYGILYRNMFGVEAETLA
ncbi:hypothetical protein MNBD_GAMMA11-886 [hydrothermal vent metagenome]|uniref:Integral membrane protein n=1 Tax=hydrothermal vent metagenome TaxID=652676 RepID=A0A3B0WVF1_9ZZZZ